MVNMVGISGFVERRRRNRYRMNDIARVDFTKRRVFSLINSSVKKSAQLIDVGRGGLSFTYEDSEMWSARFDKLSIVVGTDKIVAKDLPYSVVSDHRISTHHSATFVRRCGVRFGELTAAQKSQLDSFIQSHAMDMKAVDRRTGEDGRKRDGLQYNGPERRKPVGLTNQPQGG